MWEGGRKKGIGWEQGRERGRERGAKTENAAVLYLRCAPCLRRRLARPQRACTSRATEEAVMMRKVRPRRMRGLASALDEKKKSSLHARCDYVCGGGSPGRVLKAGWVHRYCTYSLSVNGEPRVGLRPPTAASCTRMQ